MERQITQNEVVYALDKLGIVHEDRPNSKGYIKIICPLHSDKSYGNAGVDLNTGVIHCFNCKNSDHVISLVRNNFNLSYTGALEFITGEKMVDSKQAHPDYGLKNIKRSEHKKGVKKTNNKRNMEREVVEDFNPVNYNYTRLRGFTEEFNKKFNIKKCCSGWYDNYFIIPIVDKSKGISTFEARKLSQFEYYEFLGIDEERFKLMCEKGMFVLKDYKVFSRELNEYVNNDKILYLMKPKVLYPSNSGIGQTLFNVNKLNINEDLWVSEGMGTVPKIWWSISENVTSTFGSEVTHEQIEYLSSFKKRKIIIPDNDKASLLEIEALNMQVKDLWVVDVKSEDTDKKFVDDVRNAKIMEASRYLFKEYALFD